MILKESGVLFAAHLVENDGEKEISEAGNATTSVDGPVGW